MEATTVTRMWKNCSQRSAKLRKCWMCTSQLNIKSWDSCCRQASWTRSSVYYLSPLNTESSLIATQVYCSWIISLTKRIMQVSQFFKCFFRTIMTKIWIQISYLTSIEYVWESWPHFCWQYNQTFIYSLRHIDSIIYNVAQIAQWAP